MKVKFCGRFQMNNAPEGVHIQFVRFHEQPKVAQPFRFLSYYWVVYIICDESNGFEESYHELSIYPFTTNHHEFMAIQQTAERQRAMFITHNFNLRNARAIETCEDGIITRGVIVSIESKREIYNLQFNLW